MLPTSNRMRISLTGALVALIFAQMACAEAEPGLVLANTCEGCHGIESYNNVYPTYHVPKVAGQDAAYLASALILYRDGLREHPTMTAQAAALSDQEIEEVAAYMAAAGGTQQAGDAEGMLPDAGQVCAACHGQTGISPVPGNPNLAGQYADYLEQALNQYRRGERQGPNAIAMQAQIMAVSEEDMAAIVAYYAAQEGLDTLAED